MGKNIDTMNKKRDTLWNSSMEVGVEVTQLSASIYLCVVRRMQGKIIVLRAVRKKALIFFYLHIFFFVGIKLLQQWSPWTFLICHLTDGSTIVHSKKADNDVHLRLWAELEVFVAEGDTLSFIVHICWNVWQSNVCMWVLFDSGKCKLNKLNQEE
jgi:hypothetical protein